MSASVPWSVTQCDTNNRLFKLTIMNINKVTVLRNARTMYGNIRTNTQGSGNRLKLGIVSKSAVIKNCVARTLPDLLHHCTFIVINNILK